MKNGWLGMAAAAIVCLSTSGATACDQQRIVDDAKWCFANPNNSGYGDLVVGSCNKDAGKNHNGFHDCQGHNGDSKDNFDSCTAGVQIDGVRAAAMALKIYSNPHACGF